MNKKDIRLFTIVAVHTPKFLKECLQSCADQGTSEQGKVILIDDSNNLEVHRICDFFTLEYSSIFLYYRISPCTIGAARNHGMKIAYDFSATHVTFLDCDDEVMPRYRETIFNAIEQYPLDSVLGFDCIDTRPNKPNTFMPLAKKYNFKNNMPELGRVVGSQCYRVSFLQKYNIGFPEDGSYSEDTIFNLTSFLFNGRMQGVPIKIYRYRIPSNDNASKTLRRDISKVNTAISCYQTLLKYPQVKNYPYLIKMINHQISSFTKLTRSLQLKEKTGENKPIGFFADRDGQANDSAEVLYKYVAAKRPDIKCYFAIKKDTAEGYRLLQQGFNLVDYNNNSEHFKKIYKQACTIISSHIDKGFLKHPLSVTKNIVYLHHRIPDKDCSKYLNSAKKMSVVVSSDRRELAEYSKPEYKFRNVYYLTGLARFDKLVDIQKMYPVQKEILIQLTGRNELKPNNILNSTYYKKLMNLLKSPKLKQLSEKYGYKFILSLHPMLKPFKQFFFIPRYIKMVSFDEDVQKYFSTAQALITDYSSVAFNFCYLNKPTFYWQFDNDEIYEHHTGKKGWFDYERDGFGPVSYTEEDLFRNLEQFLKTQELDQKYKDNIARTFEYRDQKNCERIYKIIEKLPVFIDK